jgi:hypothetical protein
MRQTKEVRTNLKKRGAPVRVHREERRREDPTIPCGDENKKGAV